MLQTRVTSFAPYPRTKHGFQPNTPWLPTKQPTRTFLLLNTLYMIFRPKHTTWLHSPRVLQGWLIDGCFVRDLDEKLKSYLGLGYCNIWSEFTHLPVERTRCLASEHRWSKLGGGSWVDCWVGGLVGSPIGSLIGTGVT